MVQRPATGETLLRVVKSSRAENKVGSAPWNIPADGAEKVGEVSTRGIFRRCHALRGMGFERVDSICIFFGVSL